METLLYVAIAIIVGVIPLATFCYALYSMGIAIYHFWNTLKELKPEVYSQVHLVFLGPILLFYPQFFSEKGNEHKSKLWKYLKRAILFTLPGIVFLIGVELISRT